MRKTRAQGNLPPSDYAIPVGGLSGYPAHGASWLNNSVKGWRARPIAPIDDIFFSIDTLRGRSRDLYVSNPLAAAIIDVLVMYTIGTGLVYLPKIDAEILGLSDEEAAKINLAIRQEYQVWSSTPNCDWYRRLNFPQLQEMALRTMLLSGDCPTIVAYLDRPGVDYSFVLRMIESDRVCNPLYYNWVKPIYSGIELGDPDTGEDPGIIAYHIKQIHPYQGVINAAITKHLYDWVRIEAFGAETGRPNVLMLCQYERPESPRGVPILSKVIEIMKDTSRYIEAEISAAEVAAKFIVAITSPFPNADCLNNLTEDEKKLLYTLRDYEVPIQGGNKAVFLKPEDKMEFLTSGRPYTGFDPFVSAIGKFVGAAVGVPVEVLLASYTSSYNASKGNLLRFAKRIEVLRNLVRVQLCNPAVSEFMSEAVARGRLSLPGYFEDSRRRLAYEQGEWAGSGMGSLDPQRDIAAARDRIVTGISDLEKECLSYDGSNYKAVLRQRGKERAESEVEELPYVGVQEPAKVHQTFTDKGEDSELLDPDSSENDFDDKAPAPDESDSDSDISH